MKKRFAATLCLLLSLTAPPPKAHAQAPADRPEADAIRSSVAILLGMATFGMITPPGQAAQITRSGAETLARLPLRGFQAPADAAATAVIRPADRGPLDRAMWNIVSMKVPSAGTFAATTPRAANSPISFSIGEQAIHGVVDPNLVRSCSFAATLGAVTLRSGQGNRHIRQSLGHYIADGTMSPATSGRVNFTAHTRATDWHLQASSPDGGNATASVRGVRGHLSAYGLDRAQGNRLLAAANAVMTHPAPPEQPTGRSPAARKDLRALADAASDLLTRFELVETLDDIRFAAGPTNSGRIGRMRVNITGSLPHGRLDARMDLVLDKLATTMVSPDLAAYVPRHVAVKPVVARAPIGPLVALWRAATAPHADPQALWARSLALFDDRNTRIGIESLAFDSGPMRVTGSARIVPGANGQVGATIHLAATGVDALIAQARDTPALQSALPLIFIAKGIGRAQADTIVWDISLGDGMIIVNGLPFGQRLPAMR